MKGTTPHDRAVEQVRLELVTRKAMIMVLAVVAVWVGIAITLTGAPNFVEEWFSPWSRVLVGGLSFTAGLTTTIGGMMGDDNRRGWWTQLVGLFGMAVWYAGMGVSYVGLLFLEGALWVPLGEPLPAESTGRAYAPLIYLGLWLLAVIPLVTMIRLGRPPR